MEVTEFDNAGGGDDIKLVELIVLYGAPFSGKTYYCEKHLPNHVRISLTEDASLSLHRAVKVITTHLLAGKNVVIDDTNAQAQTRKSFIGPIKASVPSCAVRAVNIAPVGGQLQCKWAATWAMEECALLNKHLEVNRSDYEINQWYQLNKTPPSQSEGFGEVTEVAMPIYSFIDRFDTKGLLLDCKAIVSFKTINDTITASMHAQCGLVLRDWQRVHPNCHIIVLIDESSLFPSTLELSGSTSKLMEGLAHCRTILRDLFLGLCLKSPLYVTCSGYDMDPQSFHKPPNLGLISWVMYRHKLSLSTSLFVGLADKVSSPVSAFPAQTGINFMKADVFFGKSGWSISSKLRMFVQENTTNNLAFLTGMVHETGRADPVEAANMVIEAAQDDLTKSCVVEEHGVAEITNFVIVYPPNQDPEPDPISTTPSSSVNFPLPTLTPSSSSSSSSTPPQTPKSKPGSLLKCPIITKAQIQNWIPDRNSFTNGQMYCNKDMVLNFCLEKSSPINIKMLCQCRGTQPNPYNVWVDVEIDDSPIIMSSFCSCPAGEYSSGKCKHVAALLLYSINESQKTDHKGLGPKSPQSPTSTNKSPAQNYTFSPKPQASSSPSSPMPFKTPTSPTRTANNVTPSPRRGLPAWMESPYKPSKSDTPASAKKRKKTEDTEEENTTEKTKKSRKKKENGDTSEGGEDGEKKTFSIRGKSIKGKSEKSPDSNDRPKKALEFKKLSSFLEDEEEHAPQKDRKAEPKKSFEDEFDEFDDLEATLQKDQKGERNNNFNKSTAASSTPKPRPPSPTTTTPSSPPPSHSPSSSSFRRPSTDAPFLSSLGGKSALLADRDSTPTKSFLNSHADDFLTNNPLPSPSTFSFVASLRSSPSKSPDTPKKVVSVKDFLKVKRGTQQK